MLDYGNNLKILVVGQTPPPLGGQAVMIQLLLDGEYPGVSLYHARMNFSKELDDTGKLQLSKLWTLVALVGRVIYMKLRWNPDVLYYPPAGPRFLPVLRDIAVLISTRWLFRKTVFHFHASGLTDYRNSLSVVLRLLFDKAFGRPDVAIRISRSAPAEGLRLGSKSEYIVANGIPDAAGGGIERVREQFEPVQILFVALLCEDKGVSVVVQAISKLLRDGANVELTCMGRWESHEMQKRITSLIDPDLRARFHFPGVLMGALKWQAYRRADIFCFPSFFHSETFPVVLLESMCFSLPIVTTRWRGIPDVVEEGSNAILVEPHDVNECVTALAALIADPAMRNRLGRNSRDRFLKLFTIEQHHRAMAEVFSALKGNA